ncbi:hypothetical protein PGT21_007306 [Puccinia graminis f. sp. tritici]|uniref:Uncharacterized protein n=1 Tax=Puccinia graminis f. sp. tritici TaxID=56615 RepID=A0A5B0N083_PUCGR|nr:hypothetical protein PGTUg99_007451 [Puccinia graminis f. sp. tritici]KAA1081489.1 hypothetical protein PGTUg99_005437 [Puccinia graminis f. sp. tritici]KAA1104010.1 hypothetical protein PGT21_007306 [Puccinia graminis f. sp. tritici]
MTLNSLAALESEVLAKMSFLPDIFPSSAHMDNGRRATTAIICRVKVRDRPALGTWLYLSIQTGPGSIRLEACRPTRFDSRQADFTGTYIKGC